MPLGGGGFDIELLNALASQNPANLSDTDNSMEALDSSPITITPSTVQQGAPVIDPQVDAWYLRLKSWVPAWFWEKEEVNKAHFMALAHLLWAHEQATLEKVSQTFIMQAEGRYLDHLAKEMGYTRLAGETDAELRDRIRSVTNDVNRPALELIIQNIAGATFKFFEWETDSSFFNRGTFLDTGILTTAAKTSRFWIYIQNSVNFEAVYNALIQSKAAGTSFVLVESAT